MNSVMRIALIALLAASPAFAQNVPAGAQAITCSSPVTADDSAKSLKLRYGDEAVIQSDLFSGQEDITYKGIALHPRSPEWRLEVAFMDDAMNGVARLTLQDTKTSHWSVVGVTIGSTLVEVQKINGKSFLVSEAQTDFDGLVVDWKGGILGRPLPGGCIIVVRFDRTHYVNVPGGRIASNNSRLLKSGPVVEQIQVRFPDK
jgi:hypothetical protein